MVNLMPSGDAQLPRGGEEAEVEQDAAPTRELPSALRPLLPVGRTIRDWWRELLIMGLASLAWFILSLTIVGGPPAGAALYTLARATALHEHPDIPLFVNALRAYFVRSWQLGAVGLLGTAVWLLDLFFYAGISGDLGAIGWLGAIFIFYVGLIWLLTLFYAWALMVCRDDLKLGQLLRNGFVVALRFPVHNFIAAFFLLLLGALAWYAPPLVVLVIPALVALLGLHNLYLVAEELVPKDVEALRIVG